MVLERIFHFALSVIAVIALCAPFAIGKKVNGWAVIRLIALEVVAAYGLLHTSIGLGFVKGFADLFHKLLACAGDGVQFVFGVQPPGAFVFFFAVLLPIIFIAVLIGIL
ncbi:UNVERIFIED_CONTAM: Na+ dependent nucleoside transporter N-terminal domain-containing protein, partial [Kocuria sp. CPCC 205274]